MVLNKNKNEVMDYPKWGEIYWAYLEPKDNEQGGWRPVFIWSNDSNNKYSPNVNVYPLTSQLKALHLPVHVLINATKENGLNCDSMAELEQPKTLNKKYLYNYIGKLSERDKVNIIKAILIQFQMEHMVRLIDNEIFSIEETKEVENAITKSKKKPVNMEVKFLNFSH